MIVDLRQFIAAGKPSWEALDRMLDRSRSGHRLSLAEIRKFHYLYERASADLARLGGLMDEPAMRHYLESLVARAYAELHDTAQGTRTFRLQTFVSTTLPRTFRRRIAAFQAALAITLAGALAGALVLGLDPASREILIPFPQLLQNPVERVQDAEQSVDDHLAGRKAQGAAWYAVHNTQVSFLIIAAGITAGIGSMLLLFSNGIMLGVVALDYIMAGQTRFLLGWLLPHGATEIPAILLAGQAGLLLGGALLGIGRGATAGDRLRLVIPDVATLTGGVVLLLIWSGFVEAFLSQYHEPVIPYTAKILFGCCELLLLTLYLARTGRRPAGDLPE